MSSTPPSAIGRYQIIQPLGQGGMGSIYLARDPRIGNRLVVIKVLREGFDNAEMRERFAREANAAGALRHINIVTIFDVGEFDGQPYIAMEYIKGQTLTELIEKKTELSLTRRVELMEGLCAGLHYAHKAGVVHRDIKPANIMIDEEGLLKIVDFGIARLRQAGTGVTRTGTVMGTLNYMAPEQMAGQPVDARADIFSFGAVMYEILSYRRAFQGEFPSIIQTILTSKREPLASIVRDLDPALIAIVDRCLSVEPGDRSADLDSVRRELAAIRQRIAVQEHLRDEANVKEWLVEARREIDRSALTAASMLVDRALSRNPASTEAMALRKTIEETRRRLVDGQDKTRVIENVLDTARQQLDSGKPDAALQTVTEALKMDSHHAETLQMKERVDSAITTKRRAEQEARAREDQERRARNAVSDARHQFAGGDRDGAIKSLEGFEPGHSIITNAIAELRVEMQALARAREETERQQLAEEVERLRREREEVQRRLATKADRERLEAEREQLRRESDEARRRLDAEQDDAATLVAPSRAAATRPASAPAAASRPAAAAKAATPAPAKKGGPSMAVIGGIAAVVVAGVVGVFMFRSSSGTAQPENQAAETQTAISTPVQPPPPVEAPKPETPPPQPEAAAPPRVETPAPAPAPVRPTPSPSNNASAAPAPRNRGQQPPPTTGGTRGTTAAQQSPTPPAQAQPAVVQQPVPVQPAPVQQAPAPQPPPAAAANPTPAPAAPAGNPAAAQQAMTTGARSEAADDLPTALQWFERAKQADPGNSAAADQAITRVRERMKKEGDAAFQSAQINDNLGRVDQAITAYEKAVRLLPDDDPKKQTARTRLAALKQ